LYSSKRRKNNYTFQVETPYSVVVGYKRFGDPCCLLRHVCTSSPKCRTNS